MTDRGIVLDRLDHLVITARDVEATCRFYETALGMRRESFGAGRVALHFGRQKINVHPYPSPVEIVAQDPRPGTADLCFVTETPIAAAAAHLESLGIEIEMGPVERRGAQGRLNSIYCRDPDGNLIEIANTVS
jgi:catechol 2,3-dioxygenase-like lactoylglutathione lyase family enzyme